LEKVSELEYSLKEALTKLKQAHARLADKEKECDELTVQTDAAKKALKTCKYELSRLETESASNIETLRAEVADLKLENEDLAELLKTKERMLED
jgi:capsule polysaccharide export protein KpsE/RkpR